MLLWVILTLMVALAACGLTLALVRRHDEVRLRATTTSILAAQLNDIEAQAAAGELPENEAQPLKTEIRRRLLAEGRAPAESTRPVAVHALPWLAIGLAGVVALAATGLYAMLGRPDLATARPPAPAPQVAGADADHPSGDVSAMIAQLEAKMQSNPNDAEGWRMLGWSYLATGRATDAVAAYHHAVTLAPHNADYRSSEGEALVRAANGQVTPSALDAFHAALKDDPNDPRTKYYLALYKDQTGDHTGAMADWITLVKSAPADAAWLPEVRRFVENVARERGLNIENKLPPAQPTAAAPAPEAPMSAQMQDANQLAPAQRDGMIHAMVDRLAGELKTNPRNEEGWERLMRARMVLGETAAAAVAYRDSLNAFVGAPDARARLKNSARSLGVPGA
jgi:cytochrome c-type biogenesis protein CcmH